MDVSASTATAAAAAAAAVAFCFKSEKVYFLARISVTTYIFRAASHEEYTRKCFCLESRWNHSAVSNNTDI